MTYGQLSSLVWLGSLLFYGVIALIVHFKTPKIKEEPTSAKPDEDWNLHVKRAHIERRIVIVQKWIMEGQMRNKPKLDAAFDRILDQAVMNTRKWG